MGTPIEPGHSLNEDARVERTNAVLTELLRNGTAEVSDLTLASIGALAKHLGWTGDPRFQFTNDGKVYLTAPRRKRNRQAVGTNVGGGPQV